MLCLFGLNFMCFLCCFVGLFECEVQGDWSQQYVFSTGVLPSVLSMLVQ